jgi:hypothetical protein
MKIADVKKAELKTEFYEETKKYILLTVYIAMILAGLKIYKRMILTEYHISYFTWGFGLFESMMLAKIILLGNFLGIGERFGDRPLMLKIIYKAFVMSVLALVFSILEYAVEGFYYDRDITGIFKEIVFKSKGELLAHAAVMFVNFIPLFAIWETGRVMGGNRLFRLLFKGTPPLTAEPEGS